MDVKLTAGLALELGPIATGMTEAARGDFARAQALVAASFLLSDAALPITGQVPCMGGGFTAA